MSVRIFLALLCAGLVGVAAWLSQADTKPAKAEAWIEVVTGVHRSKQSPHSYAVVSGKNALLIDATVPPDATQGTGR